MITTMTRAERLSVLTVALPEIEWIEEDNLRGAVQEIWLEMWEASPHADLTAAPFSKDCPEPSLVEHTRAVTRNARALADVVEEIHGFRVDRQTLYPACLLHDVSKLVEVSAGGKPTAFGLLYPHAFLAAASARQHGLSGEIVSLVVNHTPIVAKKSPVLIEGTILDHADMMSSDILMAVRGHAD